MGLNVWRQNGEPRGRLENLRTARMGNCPVTSGFLKNQTKTFRFATAASSSSHIENYTFAKMLYTSM